MDALRNWKFSLWEQGGETAIKNYVSDNLELLFFQGSSRNRNDIYKCCVENGVDLIYEGEGNIITIVDNYTRSSDSEFSLDHLKSVKKFCNGQLCTTPFLYFVQSNTYQAYKELFDQFCLNTKEVSEFRETDPQQDSYCQIISTMNWRI